MAEDSLFIEEGSGLFIPRGIVKVVDEEEKGNRGME
jgi:hypothetical protein